MSNDTRGGGEQGRTLQEEVVHLPLLFLCGSDMWGRGGLGLLRQQIEEVNAIKIEEQGGNKSSPNRNAERLGKAKGWITFPACFWNGNCSPKDRKDK